jgi:hypothetical protein
VSGEALGQSDVMGLRALVTSRQQNDHRTRPLRGIYSVAWTDADSQFRDALSNGLHVSGISGSHPLDSHQDSRPSSDVVQFIKPLREGLGLTYFDRNE